MENNQNSQPETNTLQEMQAAHTQKTYEFGNLELQKVRLQQQLELIISNQQKLYTEISELEQAAMAKQQQNNTVVPPQPAPDEPEAVEAEPLDY
jgi:hypothetical protein